MNGPLATSLIVFTLLHSAVNRNDSQPNGSNDAAFSDGSNVTDAGNCSAPRRKEVRQLSGDQLAAIFEALGARAASDEEIGQLDGGGATGFCDGALLNSTAAAQRVPYCDFRMDARLSEPERSRMFEMIAAARSPIEHKSVFEWGRANFRKLLEQRNDEVVEYFNGQPADGYKEAARLASLDKTGLLPLLLMVSREIGVGNASAEDYRLNMTECLEAKQWLEWDGGVGQCNARATKTEAPAPPAKIAAASAKPKPNGKDKGKGKGEKRGRKRQRINKKAAASTPSKAKEEQPTAEANLRARWPKKHAKGKKTTASPPANDLDLLLPYLAKPRMPKGTIKWETGAPFPLVYFTVTIIDGPLSKRGRPPTSKHRRTRGARLFLMGLNMPTGYTQITEGTQVKGSSSALLRTLDPHSGGPFVEFKIRVENRYGATCKQMCLAGQRYKRCARRIARLSLYKRFTDPIAYYKEAIDGQWTGRGYYRRKKPDYLLFQCD